MKILFAIFLVLGAVFCNAAPGQYAVEKKRVSVSGKSNLDDQYSIYFIKGGAGNKTEEVPIKKDGSYAWQSKVESPQFILVTIQLKARTRQLASNFTLYVKPGDNLKLDLNYTDSSYLTFVGGNIDNSNKALFNYSRLEILQEIRLYKNPPTKENFKKEIFSFIHAADSLIKRYVVKDKTIKQYLNIWAFNNYQEAIERFSRQRGTANIAEDTGLPKSPKELYNNKVAVLLPSSARYIDQYLTRLLGPTEKKGLPLLKAKTELLNKTFSNAELKQWLTAKNLEDAITRFSINNKVDFDAQVAQFSEIAANIKNEEQKERLVNEFKNLRYTQPGAPMPDVVFKDAKGNEVSLKSFEGRNVYIDLWASWCIPCIAEIPHLKKLEEEYRDKNIVFISLSLDADKDAWKNKMKELNLDGIQLELGDADFDKMMNVQGIPHFILYDAAGRLKLYKAPRPGTQDIRHVFDSL